MKGEIYWNFFQKESESAIIIIVTIILPYILNKKIKYQT
jgi:hypothetical protein